MKRQIFLSMIIILSVGMVTVNAQNGATNVDIQNNNVNISATENIQLSTGASGKVYYNSHELAVKSEASRSATIVIAAANASERRKAGADYVCTGENDHLIIQQALDELRAMGGSILFSEGTFYLQSQVIPSGKIKMLGQGSATHFTGKNPFDRNYLGLIMCGDDLDLIVSDMSFSGDGAGLKAITCQNGPIWGSVDTVAVGENIKSIVLTNLLFEDFDVRPINISGASLIQNMMVKGIFLRNTHDAYFGPIRQLVVSDFIFESSLPNEQIRFGPNIQSLTINNILLKGRILVESSGIVSSCICGKIELANTSKNCVVFGNKTVSGISNLGTNNQVFNNY